MAGLTDVQLRKAKPAEKSYRIADTGGLFLFVTTAGSKGWRMRYRFEGKEQTLIIGEYPQISLSDARAARDAAKAILKEGRDPNKQKKIEKLIGQQRTGETFEVIAREWHGLQKSQWTPIHSDDVINSLVKDVFPTIGYLPIREINEQLVLATLRLVEKRGANETARRLRQRISAVFVYAISSGRAQGDPAAVVTGALAPFRRGRQPAVTTLDAAREMMRKTEQTPAHPVTKLALRLIALTVARPGPLSTTPWAEFDELDAEEPVWTIPAARMKLKRQQKEDETRDHLIPLSKEAMDTIQVLRELTGRGPYVFPNSRHAHRPMSENAMGYLLNRAGYFQRHVPHGFRSTFSTIMNERFPDDRAVIDFMLAHVPKDKVEAAYNRSLYLARRKVLAQEWADLLMEGAPTAAELLSGPRKILNPDNYRKRAA
ncbi:integrase [Rhizobium sp. Root1203]|uniref:tyrosine-type recombinase/integrase n=1 Tax=Rhizobium sp. Root1203 TaxID=1736427 RepID=UPI00070B0F32|nr:integrase arm-type DNA-binding domain-containing protein [Rhizobium sp. Root1203]KQV27890.1 integrase [Rhizobium sp. Root1203]